MLRDYCWKDEEEPPSKKMIALFKGKKAKPIQFKRGDVVEIPGKRRIRGTVLKVVNDVVMFCPWNSAREDIMPAEDLKLVKGFKAEDLLGVDLIEQPRGY